MTGRFRTTSATDQDSSHKNSLVILNYVGQRARSNATFHSAVACLVLKYETSNQQRIGHEVRLLKIPEPQDQRCAHSKKRADAVVEPSFFAHELFNAFLHGKAPKKRQFLIHTKEIVCTTIRVQASRMAFAQRACWIQMIGQLRQELDRFPGRSEIGRVWLDETYIYLYDMYIYI